MNFNLVQMQGSNYLKSNSNTLQSTDNVKEQLQKQIQNIQKQIQTLNENKELSLEQKKQMQEELTKQLDEINKQIMQRELEIRQEQQKKQEEKLQEQMKASNNTTSDSVYSSLTHSLISASGELKTLGVMKAVKTKLEGDIRTEKNPERKAKLEERLEKLTENLMKKSKKINEDIHKASVENAKERTEKSENAKNDKDDSKVGKNKKIYSATAVQNEKIVYEKTIPNSVLSGLDSIKSLEKQIKDSKFFVNSVDENAFEELSDINFVVNSEFLDKIGKDEKLKKQFEDDVLFLSEFTKKYKEEQFSFNLKSSKQLWFCDENGNWTGLSIIKSAKQGSIIQEWSDEEIKILQEKAEKDLKAHFGDRFKGLRIKWFEENGKAKESKKSEEKDKISEEGPTMSRQVGINAAKLAAKISAARTASQLQTVISDIASDLRDVEEGLANGWCSQAEVAKARALMAMAQGKMGQVDNRDATPEEESAFNMASLM